ncbi:MAG: hypothetical protein WDO73_19950 [Ignavibacteriota bacterium]
MATFPALGGQTYGFRLTVKNTDGLQGTANTTVSVSAPNPVNIQVFQATPSHDSAGRHLHPELGCPGRNYCDDLAQPG